jgi:hypothetical protein
MLHAMMAVLKVRTSGSRSCRADKHAFTTPGYNNRPATARRHV